MKLTTRQVVFLVIFNLLLLPAVLLSGRVERLNQSTWTIDLEGDCYLDFHVPLKAIALACPGVDYIKLWPLPVEQPGDA